jgi:putative hydrolase of the HAD superfamily
MSDAVKPEDKALILDFGGVISRTLFETHALSEAALGLAAGTLTWQGPFAPEADALWQATNTAGAILVHILNYINKVCGTS